MAQSLDTMFNRDCRDSDLLEGIVGYSVVLRKLAIKFGLENPFLSFCLLHRFCSFKRRIYGCQLD
jgi:hypothetical protein